jgi:hypothetical protein
MSFVGYSLPFQWPVDKVRSAPERRHAIGHVRFFGPEVRFAPNFRRSDGLHGWSDFDPKRKVARYLGAVVTIEILQ